MGISLFNVDENNWKNAAILFGRNEESLNKDVNTIKNWMKTQPHLPEIMEDVKIKNFLILNKCNIEKTKQKIDMYYTIRSLIPDLYEDCNPNLPHMKELEKSMYFSVSPKLHDNLYRVNYMKIKDQDLFCARHVAMQVANHQEIRLHEDCMVGEIFVIDMGSFSINNMMQMTPSLLKKYFTMYQEVYSLRIKAAYYINSPPYISEVLSILKTILKPKIFNRIHVSEDATILNSVFSKKDIPKDFGGNGPSLEELQEMMQQKLTEYQDRFDKLDKIRVNKSLRPEKLNNDEMLGFYGHFKKLNVD